MGASADYRRWAFESAALDLALRQNDLSLGAALGREYSRVRFVVSTRGRRVRAGCARARARAEARSENDWDQAASWTRLAATGRVRVLDLKAYYTGTPVDVVPDPDFVPRRRSRLFPGRRVGGRVASTATCGGACGSRRARLSFDAPIHSVADVRALPVRARLPEHQAVALRHGRATAGVHRGTASNTGIQMYGGGQFELGVGRRQYPGAGVALLSRRPERRREYNTGEPRPGCCRAGRGTASKAPLSCG